MVLCPAASYIFAANDGIFAGNARPRVASSVYGREYRPKQLTARRAHKPVSRIQLSGRFIERSGVMAMALEVIGFLIVVTHLMVVAAFILWFGLRKPTTGAEFWMRFKAEFFGINNHTR
jgi:hypothetical protein